MRVILKIMSGSSAGRKVLLDAGQTIQVGRTEWADFSVPDDGRMSGVHFTLETDNVKCYLRDLGSTNGTRLNDQPVSDRMALRCGDQIEAGETVFSVEIEGDVPRENAAPIAPPRAVMVEPLPALSAAAVLPQRRNVEFSVETCSSGLTLCRGNVAEISPADLAVLLNRSFGVYLLVDFRKLESPAPEELAQPDYLFDWLDPGLAAMLSPVIVSQTDLFTWPELVARAWGSDAVICLFSNQDKATLLAHLRNAVRVKGKRPDQGGGILGYCWPSIMSMLLAHNTPGFVGRLLTGIDAVLVEFADLPETWQLFGQRQLAELLPRFGFQQQPPIPA